MGNINSDLKMGSQQSYDKTGAVNQTNFLIDQKLSSIQTNYLARIDQCESKEETTGATYVNLTPLVSQSDTEGSSLPMVSIPKIPHIRYQHGIAAFIVDPVPGDIVAVNVCKNDSSNIKTGVTEPMPAGSNRRFSQSDSVAVGAVHTKVPEVYITLRQDKTILIHGPQGIKVETDQNLEENVGVDRIVTIQGQRTEKISGDSNLEVSGNGTQNVNGNLAITVNGSADIIVNGSCTLKVGGSLNVSASSITFDAASSSFTGNVSIAGSLSQGAGGKAKAGGGATFANSIFAQGSITGNQDVIGGGISLKGHIHGNGNEGQDTTGPK